LPGTVRVVGEEIIAIPERPASRIIAAAVEWVVANPLRSVSTVPPIATPPRSNPPQILEQIQEKAAL
jgi:hypothetical protein